MSDVVDLIQGKERKRRRRKVIEKMGELINPRTQFIRFIVKEKEEDHD